MLDVFSMLQRMKRPGLLMAAVRAGLGEIGDYQRDRHLSRLAGLQAGAVPGPAQACLMLLELERELEEARRAASASYAPRRHVGVLMALLSEAQALAKIQETEATRITARRPAVEA